MSGTYHAFRERFLGGGQGSGGSLASPALGSEVTFSFATLAHASASHGPTPWGPWDILTSVEVSAPCIVRFFVDNPILFPAATPLLEHLFDPWLSQTFNQALLPSTSTATAIYVQVTNQAAIGAAITLKMNRLSRDVVPGESWFFDAINYTGNDLGVISGLPTATRAALVTDAYSFDPSHRIFGTEVLPDVAASVPAIWFPPDPYWLYLADARGLLAPNLIGKNISEPRSPYGVGFWPSFTGIPSGVGIQGVVLYGVAIGHPSGSVTSIDEPWIYFDAADLSGLPGTTLGGPVNVYFGDGDLDFEMYEAGEFGGVAFPAGTLNRDVTPDLFHLYADPRALYGRGDYLFWLGDRWELARFPPVVVTSGSTAANMTFEMHGNLIGRGALMTGSGQMRFVGQGALRQA